MKCSKCGSRVNEKTTICIRCGNIEGTPSCLSVCGVVAIVVIILFGRMACPKISSPHGVAPVAEARRRGEAIYIAIRNANEGRKSIGMPPVWPKTCQADTNYPGDISSRVYLTSSEFFYELLNVENKRIENHDPYLEGFDYTKLSGEGVPRCPPGQRLTATNNMWLIAANITEDDDDMIPVLITRNVDVKEIERYVNHGGKLEDTKIELGKGDYKTPFGKKVFVMVRKGGRAFSNTAKYATLRVIFEAQTLSPRDPSKPPIVYLEP